MIPAWGLLLLVAAYVGGLWAVARAFERRPRLRAWQRRSGVVSALALTVYCTSWTYYGSVGSAASSGVLFLAIYLGPMLVIVAGWPILERLVRVRHERRVTSLADAMSSRYGAARRSPPSRPCC